MELVEVREIFRHSLTRISGQIAGITLTPADRVEFSEEYYMGVIYTKGKFAAMVEFFWCKELYEYIACQMTGGRGVSDEDKVLYVNEYMNIICGKALSDINNILGKPASRLSVPAINRGRKTVGATGHEDNVLAYKTDHGVMLVRLVCE